MPKQSRSYEYDDKTQVGQIGDYPVYLLKDTQRFVCPLPGRYGEKEWKAADSMASLQRLVAEATTQATPAMYHRWGRFEEVKVEEVKVEGPYREKGGRYVSRLRLTDGRIVPAYEVYALDLELAQKVHAEIEELDEAQSEAVREYQAKRDAIWAKLPKFQMKGPEDGSSGEAGN